MTSGFVICEWEKVRKSFAEFGDVITKMKSDLVAMCTSEWGMPYGGIYPKAGTFGESTIMPELFYGFGQVAPTLTSWQSYATAIGNQGILAGSNGGNIFEDYKVGIAGFAFLDKVQRITELKFEIGDSKFPRINIEETFVYNKPAFIFENPILVDEETQLDVHGYFESMGPYKFAPLGIQMNRIPNKLQTSLTTSALT